MHIDYNDEDEPDKGEENEKSEKKEVRERRKEMKKEKDNYKAKCVGKFLSYKKKNVVMVDDWTNAV